LIGKPKRVTQQTFTPPAAPAPLNPILLLFNRGETTLCPLFDWGMIMMSVAYFTGVECFFLFNWGVAYSIGVKPIQLGCGALGAPCPIMNLMVVCPFHLTSHSQKGILTPFSLFDFD